MKKLLCITLIVMILFNFIFVNVSIGIVYKPEVTNPATPSESTPDKLLNDGDTSTNHMNFGTSIVSLVVGLVGIVFDIVAGIPFLLMNIAVGFRSN